MNGQQLLWLAVQLRAASVEQQHALHTHLSAACRFLAPLAAAVTDPIAALKTSQPLLAF